MDSWNSATCEDLLLCPLPARPHSRGHQTLAFWHLTEHVRGPHSITFRHTYNIFGVMDLPDKPVNPAATSPSFKEYCYFLPFSVSVA